MPRDDTSAGKQDKTGGCLMTGQVTQSVERESEWRVGLWEEASSRLSYWGQSLELDGGCCRLEPGGQSSPMMLFSYCQWIITCKKGVELRKTSGMRGGTDSLFIHSFNGHFPFEEGAKDNDNTVLH